LGFKEVTIQFIFYSAFVVLLPLSTASVTGCCGRCKLSIW